MNRNFLYRLRIIILAAFFIGSYLLLAARPAAASSSPWIRWKINLAFPNDKLDSQLTVQRGHTTSSGQHVIDDEETFSISCQSKGNPTIKNGEALFDGSSYYKCDVPSIQEKAWQLWQISIPNACSSKRPYVTGRVTIAGNPVDPSPENPIFYRDDIQFNTPLDVAAQEAALTVAFDQAAAESGQFVIDMASHKVTTYFTRTSPSSFGPVFVVDGNNLSATPATINQPAILSNLESTVFFGYSPAAGEYFEGSIGSLEVDPVCIATG